MKSKFVSVRNCHQDSLCCTCDSPHSTRSIALKQLIHACFVVSMSSSSGRMKTNSPFDSSSSIAEAEAEEHEPILEDVSDSDNDSDDDKGSTKKKDNCDDDDNDKEKEESKLTEFHAKNYFNSTMGGKDLRVLFAMAIGCNSMDIPDHKDPPFC